jgi:2-polyprenyl-3-methyl-5-hydroxy-6-metoxy-1,4-benzoquinol methylase
LNDVGGRPELTRETRLRRVRNLRLEVDSHNIVRVRRQGALIDCGPRGMTILDLFHRPTTFADALDRLAPQMGGAQDWMDITDVIVRLYRAGVLKDETETDDTAAVDGGFADPMVHAMMLNDRARTSGFVEAIDAIVRSGDVVVDIGTGSGVLAIAAARAGAARVYAIEAGGMARLARSVVEANALDDRITVLEGWSTQLSLPEPADVLVSEIIGEIPLDERILEVTLDARQRLVKSGARLIPARLKIIALPVSIPATRLESRIVSGDTIDRWGSWYGIDFGPLARAARGGSHVMLLDPETVNELPPVSEPALLADLDLAGFDRVQVEGDVTVAAQTAGELNGVVLYFEVQLAAWTSLSTEPRTSTLESSWRNPVWYYNEPLSLKRGDEFRVSFRYRVPGQQNGVTISRG